MTLQEQMEKLLLDKSIIEKTAFYFYKKIEEVSNRIDKETNDEQLMTLNKEAILYRNRLLFEQRELEKLGKRIEKMKVAAQIADAIKKSKKSL